MVITQHEVDELVNWMREHHPRFEIRYKDESITQSWIGWLLRPLNRDYMTLYTTVMFGKVYFPSRTIVKEWGPARTYLILRHEFIHLMDAKRFPVWFELSYLFLLPAFFGFRALWEYRGYVQNLLVEYEQTQEIQQHTLDFISQRFVGSDYGWMFPFKGWLQRLLQNTCERIKRGEITGPYPYQTWGQGTPHNGRQPQEHMPQTPDSSNT